MSYQVGPALFCVHFAAWIKCFPAVPQGVAAYRRGACTKCMHGGMVDEVVLACPLVFCVPLPRTALPCCASRRGSVPALGLVHARWYGMKWLCVAVSVLCAAALDRAALLCLTARQCAGVGPGACTEGCWMKWFCVAVGVLCAAA